MEEPKLRRSKEALLRLLNEYYKATNGGNYNLNDPLDNFLNTFKGELLAEVKAELLNEFKTTLKEKKAPEK